MAVSRDAFRPADLRGVETLGPADLADIERLYADGLARGESPDFFFSSMLQQGMFRGVRRRGELVAVAGTHLFAPGVGVCAIGNVYTRLDCRGRGLASVVTSAVVAEAFGRCAETVVLNVRQTNDAARRVYERLGFERYCEFVEGEARRAPQ
jgi:predicted GNAT family acetyltransferase